MANIASQKKRIARTLRERDENRRYTSSVKTAMRKLEETVAAKDAAATEDAYQTAVSRIDKAVRSGAFHKNTGARRKSRAARLRASL